MALKIRRGTDAQRLLITLLSGELGFTTDTKHLYIGDGVTPGGLQISRVKEFFYNESLSRSSHTSINFVTKLTLNFTVIGGNYVFEWDLKYDYSPGRSFRFQLLLDSATVVDSFKERPAQTGTTQSCPRYGVGEMLALSAGPHTLELQWACENNGDTAGIQGAKIVVYNA